MPKLLDFTETVVIERQWVEILARGLREDHPVAGPAFPMPDVLADLQAALQDPGQYITVPAEQLYWVNRYGDILWPDQSATCNRALLHEACHRALDEYALRTKAELDLLHGDQADDLDIPMDPRVTALLDTSLWRTDPHEHGRQYEASQLVDSAFKLFQKWEEPTD